MSPWWFRQWRVCLQCRRSRFDPWVGKIPWRRKWQPTPVSLPGKSQWQRSLAGYSPQGCKELDTTEQLHFLSFSESENSTLDIIKDFCIVSSQIFSGWIFKCLRVSHPWMFSFQGRKEKINFVIYFYHSNIFFKKMLVVKEMKIIG